MSTATLTRGTIYGLEYSSIYTDGRSSHIGHWLQNLWNEREYGAVAVEYSVPTVSDRMENREVTIPVSFIQFQSSPALYASLSTKEPDSAGYWRFGPTAGVISDEVRFYHNTRSIVFTVTDLVWLSGKKIYLYLYDKNGGDGTSYAINAVQFGSAGNGTLSFSPAYSLSIHAGAGSTITVSRQSSDFVNTGAVSDGDPVYTGESLKISASPQENYMVTSLTVNGSDFTSGNTYTVNGDVTVVSTAQVLSSSVGATDADVESVSTITVTRYNDSYVHSLSYSFGSESGYITSSGGTSQSETKMSATSIAFTVPVSFYSQIQNTASGTCTITCTTYQSQQDNTVLGTPTTCTFTVRAAESRCSPIVSGTVTDTSASAIALTGDASKLIRFISSALCTISATARNGASIVQKSINGTIVDGATLTISGDELLQTTFLFSATDSRGFTATESVEVILIPYIRLTCNPELSRVTPTGGGVQMSFNGMAYSGDWRDGVANRVSVRYRYREPEEAAFSSWIPISSGYTMQSSGYSSTSPIILEDVNGSTTGFDYRKAYVFQIEVSDGDGTTVCSTVTTDASIREGIPVFDWGKTDFKFNVPVTISSSIYSPSITIGSTSITEEQLQRLLALLS